jgi:uncharacterized protein (TIGR03437 family)
VVDSSGQFIFVYKSLFMAMGDGGSFPVLCVYRFTWDMEVSSQITQLFFSGSELESLNLDNVEPIVGIDSRDRFYLGGTDRSGQIWLLRSDGWRLNVVSATGTLAGIAFDDTDSPVLLVNTSGRPALWQVGVDQGIVSKRFEFGQAGQMARAMTKGTNNAVWVITDTTVLRISDLSRIDFEVGLGSQTELRALAAGEKGLYVVGSTPDTPDAAKPFTASTGAYMPMLPGRATLGNPVGIVALLDQQTGTLLAATYLGASIADSAKGVAVDSDNVYVLGTTSSPDFPATGAYRTACGPDRPTSWNNESSFIATLNPELTTLRNSATFPFENIRELSALANGVFTLRAASAYEGSGGLFRFEPASDASSVVRCMVNSASYEPLRSGAVPGQLMTVFGQGLGPQEISVYDGQAHMPREVDGTEVLFDDVPVPLLAVLSTQINFQVPFYLPDTTGQGWIEVRRGGQTLVRRRFGKGDVDPTPMVHVNDDRTLAVQGEAVQADIVNEDGSSNSLATPAAAGSLVHLFATGTGALMDPNPDEDSGSTPAATPHYSFLIATANGMIEPESASTQAGRTKGVVDIRFRIPAAATGAMGFALLVKTSTGVEIADSPLPYVLFVR